MIDLEKHLYPGFEYEIAVVRDVEVQGELVSTRAKIIGWIDQNKGFVYDYEDVEPIKSRLDANSLLDSIAVLNQIKLGNRVMVIERHISRRSTASVG